jgi:glycosyltransferase involved in cell wall biosynthesis
MTLCLNMIVKNESRVIKRCLQSVKKIIDYWVIVDTGSMDGTQQIIKECMAGLPGELHERPWVDFSHNRNEALALAKNKGDYLLFMDADEQLMLFDFDKKKLINNSYFIRLKERGNIETYRLAIVKNDGNWRWRRPLHESISHSREDHMKSEELPGLIIDGTALDGNRSSDTEKHLKDLKVLKKALREDPSDSHTVFYLAQTYGWGNQLSTALEYYHQRVAMEGYFYETFWSLYCIGILQEYLNMDPELFIPSYRAAHEYDPTRAEPLYRMAHYLHRTRQSQAAYPIVKQAISLSQTPLPFHAVQTWIYDYGLLTLFADVAYAVGEKKEALCACKQLLSDEKLPKEIKTLVKKNFASLESRWPQKLYA